MKRKLSLLRVVVFGLALLTGTASAQLPQIISYQGIDLLNPNSTIDVTVSIFDAATGGANLWSEDHMGTSTSTIGTFSILIGSKSTIPLGTLNWNKAYWLEIQISGVAMTPRTELAASPYAFEALEALGVADGSIVPDDINDGGTDPRDGEVLAYNAQSGNFQWVAAGGSDSGSGALDQIVAGPGIQVTNGTGPVVTVGVASQGITSGMIANDAINTRHIAPGAVASAQIAANAVITQHIGPQQVTLPKINSRGASFGQAIMYNGVTLIYGFPTPGGPAGGELSGTYPNPIIADNVIDGDNVIDESLTGADILNESIGVDDIGPDAVGTSEIINESILSEDIDTGAVTTSEILNETILSEDIATGAVTTDEILNETILSEDIMDGTILSDDIAAAGLAHTALITTIDITIPNAERDAVWQKIYSEVIENETIRAEDIATGAVTTSEILDGTILSDDIATGRLNTALITVGNPVANTADAVWREIYSEVIEDETIRAEDIATGAVTTSEIMDETIRAVDIDTSAVTTSEIMDETILKEDIATGAVTTSEIMDSTILSEDIMDGTILSDDIAIGPAHTALITMGFSDSAVSVAWEEIYSEVIEDETIRAEDIATGAVTTDEIMDETILSEDILNETIQTVDIADSAVTMAKIADGAVTTSEILDETILSDDIATGAVTTSEILDETILKDDIATGAVTTSEILDETILSDDIATGAVTTSEILDGTILSDDIATGRLNTALITVGNPVANTADAVWREIYSEVIEDETIRAEDIATGAVRTEEILDETIRAVDIDTSAVTTGEILDETILKEDIATGAVTTDEILDGDVQTVDIADLGVTTAKIDNLGVTTAKIADDAVTYTKVSSVGGAAGQVLKINSANDVVWQNDDVTLPWVEIDTTSGTWTIELQKQGTSRGVFRGFVSDSANDSPAIEGVTQGTGPGINAISLYGTGVVATGVNGANFTATGSGDALNAQNTGGAGRAGFFNNTDANNANDVVVAQSSGPITPGNAVVKVDATNLNGGAGVAVKVNGRSGDAVDAQNIGDTGRAGLFSNTSTANENDVVVAHSSGPIMPGNAVVKVNATNLDGGAGVAVQIDGWGDAVNAQNESDIGRAGFFSNTDIANENDVVVARSIGPIMLGHAVVQAHATNLSGGAGVRSNVTGVSGWAGVFDSDSGTDGVRIESNSTNNDAVALWLEQGAMKLTYRVGAGDTTVMNHDDVIVVVPDNNTPGTTNSVMLPSAGVDGQVIYVINGDGDAALSSRALIGTIIGQIVGVTSIGQNRVRGFIWSTGEGGWMPLGQ